MKFSIKYIFSKFDQISRKLTSQKVSRYEVVSGPYFPVFDLNTVKYGPEITQWLQIWSNLLKISLLSKSTDWFLYDRELHHEKVNGILTFCVQCYVIVITQIKQKKLSPWEKFTLVKSSTNFCAINDIFSLASFCFFALHDFELLRYVPLIDSLWLKLTSLFIWLFLSFLLTEPNITEFTNII